MGRIISIDYGRARIGIAVTDVNKMLAMPYKTIKTHKNIEILIDNLIAELNIYLDETEKIIIGNPLHLNGKKSDMSIEVEKFKAQFEKKVNIPIILWDERLTSKQAEKELKKINLSRKKRAQKSDNVAATILLDSYLNSPQN